MTDYISRADAIDTVHEYFIERIKKSKCDYDEELQVYVITKEERTMLTYNKGINDKLRSLPSAEAVQGWIPCSERLPKAEDMYQPPEQRYLCQLEAYGERKFCVLSRLKGAVSPFWDWYGVAIHDFEVTAWMPLPKPYKGGDDE